MKDPIFIDVAEYFENNVPIDNYDYLFKYVLPIGCVISVVLKLVFSPSPRRNHMFPIVLVEKIEIISK